MLLLYNILWPCWCFCCWLKLLTFSSFCITPQLHVNIWVWFTLCRLLYILNIPYNIPFNIYSKIRSHQWRVYTVSIPFSIQYYSFQKEIILHQKSFEHNRLKCCYCQHHLFSIVIFMKSYKDMDLHFCMKNSIRCLKVVL